MKPQKDCVSSFLYLISKGYIIEVGPNQYSLGKEPDLFEEDDFLIKFWYLFKKKTGEGSISKVFSGPKELKKECNERSD